MKVVKRRNDGVVQRYNKSEKNKWEVLTAWGDWHKGIPKGHHGLFVGKGGRKANGMYPEETRYVIVPAGRYSQTGNYANVWLDDATVEKYESENFTEGEE